MNPVSAVLENNGPRGVLGNIFSYLDLDSVKRAALVSALCWSVALLASVPHLVFTKINYIDYPYHSGTFICDSAFCAMLDENIHPSVNQNLTFN